MKTRTFTFAEGHMWQVVADRRNSRPFMQVRISEGDRLLARLEGNPFSSLFQEQIATWAASRDGLTADLATQRFLSISDTLFPPPSHTTPLKGGMWMT